jgi:hypothetical protein
LNFDDVIEESEIVTSNEPQLFIKFSQKWCRSYLCLLDIIWFSE